MYSCCEEKEGNKSDGIGSGGGRRCSGSRRRRMRLRLLVTSCQANAGSMEYFQVAAIANDPSCHSGGATNVQQRVKGQ
eukprot:746522-Hanusia_phi.AAC.16